MPTFTTDTGTAQQQPHTYVAGEDDGRLASTAQSLGLDRRRRRRPPVREWQISSSFWNNDVAARMHSVGVLGRDERVDALGTLHRSVRRRRNRGHHRHTVMGQGSNNNGVDGGVSGGGTPTSYGALEDLFQNPTMEESVTVEESSEEENDDDEVVVEDVVQGGSLNAAIFGIVKGTVGPAILYLPHGFYTSGYGVAIPAMLLATGMYIFNAHRLLACYRTEHAKNHALVARMEEVRALLEGSHHRDFQTDKMSSHAQATTTNSTTTTTPSLPPVLTPALLSYPELARRAFGRAAVVVDLGIACMQFGVCLTYLIFVPQNLRECTLSLVRSGNWWLLWLWQGGGADDSVSSTMAAVPSTEFFLVAMILMEVPLGWIRDIRKLTLTNVIATVLIAYGLCAVLVLAVSEGLSYDNEIDELVFARNLASLPAWTDTWFIFVGTSFFMMEGSITLLVPLQQAVFREQDKARFPMVNQTVTLWIVVFYVVFSMVCVAAFGDGIRTALTASLTGILAATVQLAYSVAVILTFPLQAFPAMEVVFNALLGKKRDDGRVNPELARNILATFLTLLLGVIAYCSIDYLGNVVSILGSLFGIPLALVFPPLMHNILVKESSNIARVINYIVVGIGFLAMGAASYATVASWDKGAEDAE